MYNTSKVPVGERWGKVVPNWPMDSNAAVEVHDRARQKAPEETDKHETNLLRIV